LGTVVHACHSNYTGKHKYRIAVLACPSIEQDPTQKQPLQKGLQSGSSDKAPVWQVRGPDIKPQYRILPKEITLSAVKQKNFQFSFFVVLGVELSALCMLGKCSTQLLFKTKSTRTRVEGRILIKSNVDGLNFSKIHYMQVVNITMKPLL
jgi:hypothetical protein